MTTEYFCFLNNEGSQLYFDALKLMQVDSKLDPITEPYKSHYKAREILQNLIEKVECLQKVQNNDDLARVLGVVHLKLAINAVETEELSLGEDELKKCHSLIDNCANDYEKNTGIRQEVLNQLGLLNSQRLNLEKGLDYLLESKSLYEKFQKEHGGCPWSVDNFFQMSSFNADQQNPELVLKKIARFEDNYTHTLYFLAQVYGKLGNSVDSALYCKETLKRQLDSNKYEPLEWSMNAATLSQYYITIQDFTTARHCLASAEIILKEFGEKPSSLKVTSTNENDQDTINTLEKLPKAWADLFRCWIKYGLALLEYSKDILMEKSETENGLMNSQNKLPEHDSDKEFFNLEVTNTENQITDKNILVFDEARQVFLKMQTWINSAKEFYELYDHCSDHVEIIKDNSSLYKLIIFFEADLSRQCKMHKRRVDMLSEILNQLNPQFYLAVCCQLSFEIAEIYSAMLDNKLALLELSSCSAREKEQASKKINILAKQGIEYFQKYLKFLKTNDQKFPDKFQDDDERPALIAHFYCGRLFSKITSADPKETLKNTKNTLDNYSFLVDYCNRNPSAVEKVKEERMACEEMVKLLPAKMDKIKSSME